MSIDQYSDKELEREIERRKQIKEAVGSMPEMLPEDVVKDNLYNGLKGQVTQTVKSIATEGYHDDNDDHYAWETVMESFFGKDYFKWHNKNCR